MLHMIANKSKETTVKQVSKIDHYRVLRHVKATCNCHTWSVFAVDSCVTIASAGLNLTCPSTL